MGITIHSCLFVSFGWLVIYILFFIFYFYILLISPQSCYYLLVVLSFTPYSKVVFFFFWFSELQSNVDFPSKLKVNGHKRQASSLLLDSSKKKLCARNQSPFEHETTCYDGNNSEDMQSGALSITRVSVWALLDGWYNFL